MPFGLPLHLLFTWFKIESFPPSKKAKKFFQSSSQAFSIVHFRQRLLNSSVNFQLLRSIHSPEINIVIKYRFIQIPKQSINLAFHPTSFASAFSVFESSSIKVENILSEQLFHSAFLLASRRRKRIEKVFTGSDDSWEIHRWNNESGG